MTEVEHEARDILALAELGNRWARNFIVRACKTPVIKRTEVQQIVACLVSRRSPP